MTVGSTTGRRSDGRPQPSPRGSGSVVPSLPVIISTDILPASVHELESDAAIRCVHENMHARTRRYIARTACVGSQRLSGTQIRIGLCLFTLQIARRHEVIPREKTRRTQHGGQVIREAA